LKPLSFDNEDDNGAEFTRGTVYENTTPCGSICLQLASFVIPLGLFAPHNPCTQGRKEIVRTQANPSFESLKSRKGAISCALGDPVGTRTPGPLIKSSATKLKLLVRSLASCCTLNNKTPLSEQSLYC
jgi:hypothetical protein